LNYFDLEVGDIFAEKESNGIYSGRRFKVLSIKNNNAYSIDLNKRDFTLASSLELPDSSWTFIKRLCKHCYG
jgi:hypothetical protein